MKTEVKLPFGLNENSDVVHIAEVVRGKKCLCFCPSCRLPLIAIKGGERQHHFRHSADVECAGGLESAIHSAAKKLIRERKQIVLPGYVCIVSEVDSKGKTHTHNETVVKAGTVVFFDSIEEEKDLNGIRAYILVIKGNQQLMIEFCYRHRVDEHKQKKISDANVSAIEITLSDLTPDHIMDWESFWSCINDPARAHWLHNAKAHDSVAPKLKNRLAKEVQNLERRYHLERVRKQKQEKFERAQLTQALDELRIFRSKSGIEIATESAGAPPGWKCHSQGLSFSWQDLPDFLNVDVPDGDWIFGCDRRLWQTACYSHFILKSGKPFSTIGAFDWLRKEAGFKVARCSAIIGKFRKLYPGMIPREIVNELPSPWGTLRAYFNHLYELDML